MHLNFRIYGEQWADTTAILAIFLQQAFPTPTHPRVFAGKEKGNFSPTFTASKSLPGMIWSIPAFSSDWYSSGIPSTKTVEALHKNTSPIPKGANSVKVVDMSLKRWFFQKGDKKPRHWTGATYFDIHLALLF